MAEVQYYFRLTVNDVKHSLAMVSLYSPPDLELWKESHNTIWSCRYQGQANIRVVEVKSVMSVIAMVPFPVTGAGGVRAMENLRTTGRFFMVEKPGLDVAPLNGAEEDTRTTGDEDDSM